MITRAPGTKPGKNASLIRLDPQYRQPSHHIEYPPEDGRLIWRQKRS